MVNSIGLVWLMEVDRSHVHVVCRGVMLGEVVSQVSGSWLPVNVELALFHSVFEPIEAHVNGFGSFLFDGISEDANTCLVVSAQWRSWLGMT